MSPLSRAPYALMGYRIYKQMRIFIMMPQFLPNGCESTHIKQPAIVFVA